MFVCLDVEPRPVHSYHFLMRSYPITNETVNTSIRNQMIDITSALQGSCSSARCAMGM